MHEHTVLLGIILHLLRLDGGPSQSGVLGKYQISW